MHKNKKTLVLFGLIWGDLAALALFVAGCVLVGLYYQMFATYQALNTNFYTLSGKNSPGFITFWRDYNTLANQHNWIQADYTFFALGLGLFWFGVILLVFFIWLHWRWHKKTHL